MPAWLAARAVDWTIARRRRSIGRLMVSEAGTRHFFNIHNNGISLSAFEIKGYVF